MDIHAGSYDLADDALTSITPSKHGAIMVSCQSSELGAFIAYDCSAPASRIIYAQKDPAFEVGTGKIDDSADGTDGKFTIKVHTDGKIYFLNRLGGTRSMIYSLLGVN